MNPGHPIDCKALRKGSPEAAGLTVLESQKANGCSIFDAGRVAGINWPAACDIIGTQGAGDCEDRCRLPKRQLNGTPAGVEQQVVGERSTTRIRPKRLRIRLAGQEGMGV